MNWIIFVLMLLLSPPLVLKSEAPDLKFKYFGKKDGISNTFVTSIAQDSIGYIWIGTINGLNKFDGKTIKVYQSFVQDSTTISNNSIKNLYTDKKGVLWIATIDGLCSYNIEKDNFIRYKFDQRYSNTELFNTNRIAENSLGEIFVSSHSVIYKLDNLTKVFSPYISISPGDISSIVIDKNNNFWIGGLQDGGLTFFNSKELRSYKYPTTSDVANKALINSQIQDLEFKDHKLWIATRGSGLISLDTASQKFQSHPISLPNTDQILDLYVDKNQQLWTVDYTGLKLFNSSENIFYNYYTNYDLVETIHNLPVGFFQDNQMNYWVIHFGGGIGIRTPPKGFKEYKVDKYTNWSLSRGDVNAVSSDTEGNYWFAISRPGIDVFEWENGKPLLFGHDSNQPKSLGSGTVFSIFRDWNQQMWVGTYDGGLGVYNYETKNFTNYKHSETDPNSISGNDIRSIDQDDKGNIWVAVQGAGVDCFNPKTKRFSNLNKAKNNLSNPWTNQVLCTENGDLWVATTWGLNRLAKGESKFRNYYFEIDDTTSICSSNVNVVFEDGKGSIWVGSDNGLNKYVESTNSFIRFTKGFNSTSVCAILEDQNNKLWLSTLSGISCFDPKTGIVLNFDESDGIYNDQFIVRSSYKDYNGIMFFGGVDGVTVIDPPKIKLSNLLPPVIITSLKVLNKSTDPNDKNSILKTHISQIKYFELSHTDKLITFEFLALTYNNPKKIEYAYMLEGFDKNWQYIKNANSVSFTNLDPGIYTFRVKALTNNGVWNEKVTSVRFKVLPAWYATNLAKIFSLVVLGFFVWLFLKIRTKQINRQNRLLSMQVVDKTQELLANNQELMAQAEYLDSMNKLLQERQQKVEKQTEILSKQSNALRQSNQQLSDINSTKDKLFSIIAHDLLNPFNAILGMTELLNSTYDELTDAEKKELVLNVNTSSNRLFNLLQNLLLWARSQTNTINFQQENFIIRDAIEESTEYYLDQFNNKSISFSIECNDDITGYADVDMFKTIIRNLVSNAIKFTRKNGEIKINVQNAGDFISVSTSDNGVGMNHEISETLFKSKGIKGQEGTEGERGTGLGLIICKEFVERNHGTISVWSEKGMGSRFTFTIPVSKW